MGGHVNNGLQVNRNGFGKSCSCPKQMLQNPKGVQVGGVHSFSNGKPPNLTFSQVPLNSNGKGGRGYEKNTKRLYAKLFYVYICTCSRRPACQPASLPACQPASLPDVSMGITETGGWTCSFWFVLQQMITQI
jgi:hypothetical protein